MAATTFGLVVIGGCGGSDDPFEGATPTTTGNEEWCAAMAELADAQPSGSLSEDEHRAAYLAYIEAINAAALVARNDGETLRKLAEASRLTAEDPGDPRQAELYAAIADDMFRITTRAQRDCDITFG